MNIPIFLFLIMMTLKRRRKKKKNKIKSFNLFTTNKRNPTNRNSISHNLNYYIIEILSLFFRCRRRRSFARRLGLRLRYDIFSPFNDKQPENNFK